MEYENTMLTTDENSRTKLIAVIEETRQNARAALSRCEMQLRQAESESSRELVRFMWYLTPRKVCPSQACPFPPK
jgi:hypothetical protein